MPHSGFRGCLRQAGAFASVLTISAAGSATAATGGAAAGSQSVKRATARMTDATGHIYPDDSVHMGDRILRQGMSGHDVRVLQDFLGRAGFLTPIVGRFGPQTKQNLIAFQRSKGMTANGVLTFAVSQALRAAAAAQVSATTPTGKGTVLDGLAVAPAGAPGTVRAVIAAGNRIATTPYVWGGGHGSWNSSGYDCSGSVSYALHGGNLLSSPEDSSAFESYGSPGRGSWITIWTNPGHAYMFVAGLRFDTSAQRSTGGSRWTTQGRSNAGFDARHPVGW